ncbi:hypothetical protein MnBA_35730 [Marinobacterium sp. BA1]
MREATVAYPPYAKHCVPTHKGRQSAMSIQGMGTRKKYSRNEEGDKKTPSVG